MAVFRVARAICSHREKRSSECSMITLDIVPCCVYFTLFIHARHGAQMGVQNMSLHRWEIHVCSRST